MRCEQWREAASARLDGEEPTDPTAFATHERQCPDCRAWLAAAIRTTRLARVSRAEDVPDLTDAIMAATVEARSSRRPGRIGLRAALLLVALVQLGIAVQTLLSADSAAAHVTHEISAFNAALAVGFLWAVVWPQRAVGQLPVMTALVVLLIAVTLPDLLAGHAHGSRELMHGLLVAGLVLLTALAGHFSAPPSSGGWGRKTGSHPTRPTADPRHGGSAAVRHLGPREVTGRASSAA